MKLHDKKNLEFFFLEGEGFKKRSIEDAVKITMRMQAPVILEPERQ